jgi:hypothetical protein
VVDEMTWQLFNYTVGHSVVTWSYAMLQVLDDVSHFMPLTG